RRGGRRLRHSQMGQRGAPPDVDGGYQPHPRARRPAGSVARLRPPLLRPGGRSGTSAPPPICSFEESMREPIADRPGFPKGYGIDREHRADMLAWDAARQKLIDARNYWVSTTRPDGRPHVTPVWGLWMDEAFYFSTDPQSRKGRNLAAQPAINVH